MPLLFSESFDDAKGVKPWEGAGWPVKESDVPPTYEWTCGCGNSKVRIEMKGSVDVDIRRISCRDCGAAVIWP